MIKKIVVTYLILLSSSWAKINIATYNIRNFDYDERARIFTNKPELKNLIQKLTFDLMGVNEINNANEFRLFVQRDLAGFESVLTNCGGAHGQKLGFIFNKTKLKLHSFTEDLRVTMPGGEESCSGGSRPMAVALFENLQTKVKFYAIQVHFKSGGTANSFRIRFQQYEQLNKTLKELTSGATKDYVVMGDFNTTGYVLKDEDHREFEKLLVNAKAKNLSKDIGCSAYWWGGSDDGIESPSQLDHIVVSQSLMAKYKTHKTEVHAHCKKVKCQHASLKELGMSYEEVSDHCPQTASLQ